MLSSSLWNSNALEQPTVIAGATETACISKYQQEQPLFACVTASRVQRHGMVATCILLALSWLWPVRSLCVVPDGLAPPIPIFVLAAAVTWCIRRVLPWQLAAGSLQCSSRYWSSVQLVLTLSTSLRSK